MKFAVLLGLLLGCGLQAQEKPKVADWHFVAAESFMYSSILAHGAFSMRYVGNCATEASSSAFAKDGGFGFRSGKFFAVNLGIAGGLTATHIVVRKYGHSRFANWFTDVLEFAFGSPHAANTAKWVSACR